MTRTHHLAAALAASLVACGGPAQSGTGGGGSLSQAFVLTVANDYSSGAFATVDLATLQAAGNLGPAHTDAVARLVGDRLYLVNRFGADNLQELDPGQGFSTLHQWSTGEGSNPHDVVALTSDTLLVSRYASSELLLLDPDTGVEAGTVSLAALADADGSPEPSQMQRLDSGDVLVACQRLEDFAPSDYSAVAVVTPDGSVVERRLAGTNPFTPFVPDPGGDGWLLGVAGSTLAIEADQGIERLAADGSSSGLAVSEEVLGGSVTAFSFASGEDRGWAIVNVPVDPDNFVSETHLVRFDLASGTKTADVLAPGGFVLNALAVDPSNRVWIADRDFERPGVRVFDGTSGEELTEAPIDVGLPPSDLLFL